jgi:hypothetical protein
MKESDPKNLKDLANALTLVIAESARASIPLSQRSFKSKPWWASELRGLRRALARAVYTAKIAETAEFPESTEFRIQQSDLYKTAGNAYFQAIKTAKKTTRTPFLEKTDS